MSLFDAIGKIEADATQRAEQIVQPLNVGCGERRAEDRRDVGAQMRSAAGAEQDDVGAGFVACEAVGGIGETFRATFFEQEAEGVFCVYSCLLYTSPSPRD